MSIPAAITGIRIVDQLHDHKYKVTWDSALASPVITQYNIYRSNSVYGTFTKIISVTADTKYFDELPVDFNGLPFYKVTAVNSDGESTLSLSQAQTDTDVFTYMHVPEELNIKYYNYEHQTEWMFNIVPDGSNRTFYLDYNYKPESLEVFVNRKKLNAGEFTESTSNAFTLSVSLTIGDLIDCNFVKG